MKAVNLLPRDLRGAHSAPSASGAAEHIPGGPGAVVVLGALALSVAAVAGYVITGNTIHERENQLAGLTARQQAAEARSAKLKPFADFATLATARVETVNKLADTRFDFEQAVRDLSRAIPANVTLASIETNLGGAAAGGGSVALRSAITAPAMSLKGCTVNQAAVAKLLSQLRSIDGVTRVTLGKTERPQTTTAPTTPSDSASAQQATNPCGAGSHPSFDAVVFFENDAALSAGDIETSVASTATSTPATTTSTAGAAAATTPATTTSGTATTPATSQPTSTSGTVR
jgi:Tfp pilus assembly protein PilN